MADYYAWVAIHNGGETGEVERYDGTKKTVVLKRNIIEPGAKVTKAKSGLSDEDWDRMIDNGSIRNYPFPEGTDEHTSPTTAFMRNYLNAQGDVDTDALMALGMTNPPPAMNPPASEGKEIEAKPVGV